MWMLAKMAKGSLLTGRKCAKHVPGKKTAFGDKPAVRRREGLLDTSRMAYVRGVRTVEEFRVQRAAVSPRGDASGEWLMPSCWR